MVGTIPDKQEYIPKPERIDVSFNVKLPFTIKYNKGELWYGYLCRLAIANGYNSTYSFLRDINSNKNIQWDYYNQRMGYDCDRPLGDIANIKDGEWLIEGTPLGVMAMLSSRTRLGMFVRKTSWKTSKDNQIVAQTPSYVQTLRICPKCKKTEGADWYIHLCHNLPGVTVCKDHGCALHEYKGVKGYEMTNDNYSAIEPTDDALEYAKFMAYLQDNCLECSIRSIKDACIKELEKRDITRKELKTWLKENVGTSLESYRFNGISTQEAFSLIKALFGGSPGFISALGTYHENRKEEFLASIKGRFELVGEYRDTIVRVRCLKCGTVFPETPISLIQGWGCPKCSESLSEDEIALQILQRAADKGWTSDFRHFSNWSTPYKFTDKDGKTVKMKLFNFVAMISGESQKKKRLHVKQHKQGKAGVTEKKVAAKEQLESRTKNYAESVEKHGFVLEGWYQRKENAVFKLKHKECGGSFEVLRVNFLLSPYCRCCTEIRPKTVQNGKREALGKDRVEQLRSFIETYCLTRKGHIISNEEIASQLGTLEKKHVSNILSVLKKKGKVDHIGPRLWCNHEEEYSIDDIIYACFNRGMQGYEGFPVCDSLYIRLGGCLENPTRAYAFKDRGKGTAHLDHTTINDVPVVKIPTIIDVDKVDIMSFSFIMTLWNSSLLSKPELIDEIYMLLCKKGMSVDSLSETAKKFPALVRKKLAKYLEGKEGEKHE